MLTRAQIIAKHRDSIRATIENGDIELSPAALSDIYDWYVLTPDSGMPYGTMKARDGDHDEYIYEHLGKDFNERIGR